MVFLNKRIEELTLADLQSLVEGGVREGKQIEYKLTLPSWNRSGKIEFLADVSSFANVAGGYLLYGVDEEKGVAKNVVGLDSADADAELLRIQNIMRAGIEPRIPRVHVGAVPVSRGRVVVVIRVPRSWALPHRVSFEGHSRFYCRTSGAQKYALDVSELRALFGMSEALGDKLRSFRLDRLATIAGAETPVPIREEATIVLHVIPVAASDLTYQLDVETIARHTCCPLHADSWSGRYNFDGYVTYSHRSEDVRASSYAQFFRNGSVEAVETGMLDEGFIPSVLYEEEVLTGTRRFLDVQKQLGIEPPVLAMLSLLHVKGCRMGVRHLPLWAPTGQEGAIARDSLTMPEALIDEFDCDLATKMKPVFDAVWNAAGWPRSMNYDEEGRWIKD
jgi:hypothetical protein